MSLTFLYLKKKAVLLFLLLKLCTWLLIRQSRRCNRRHHRRYSRSLRKNARLCIQNRRFCQSGANCSASILSCQKSTWWLGGAPRHPARSELVGKCGSHAGARSRCILFSGSARYSRVAANPLNELPPESRGPALSPGHVLKRHLRSAAIRDINHLITGLINVFRKLSFLPPFWFTVFTCKKLAKPQEK